MFEANCSHYKFLFAPAVFLFLWNVIVFIEDGKFYLMIVLEAQEMKWSRKNRNTFFVYIEFIRIVCFQEDTPWNSLLLHIFLQFVHNGGKLIFFAKKEYL